MSEPSVSTSSPVSIWHCYLSTWLKHDIRFHHSAGDIICRKANAFIPEFKPSDEISEVPFFIRYKFDFWITSWTWKSEGHQWKCKQYLSLANIPSLLKLLTFSHRPAKFASMMRILLKLILNILLRPQKDSDLVLKNLMFRQQLAIQKRPKKRTQIRTKDRLFWIMLCRFRSNWQEPLIVVNPETVIRWYRKGFKLFWKFKSWLKGPGPPISPEIRDL